MYRTRTLLLFGILLLCGVANKASGDSTTQPLFSQSQGKSSCASQEQLYKGKTVEAWINQLQDSNFRKRTAAIKILATIPQEAKKTVPALIAFVRNQSRAAI